MAEYFSFFIKSQIYGSHDKILAAIKLLNDAKPNSKVYFNRIWEAEHQLKPLFKRLYPADALTLNFTELVSLEKIVDTELNIFYYKPDRAPIDELAKNYTIENFQQFDCKNCDSDDAQLVTLSKK